jgi:hypothetical protein
LKYESEKEIGDHKDKYRSLENEYSVEIQALQTKADDRRDRELIRQLRRELEDHKRRNNDMITEQTDLRKDRDSIKMELNEEMIRHARELEDERNQKRLLQSENDKVSFKSKCTEDEMQKIRLKTEKKAQEVTSLLTEKNSITGIMKEKDLLIDSHVR